ncbi:peptidase [Polynucleobacter asymbioticus]|uniref:M50 family metallopeptidase n=1 Tax=Polynucleobacter asymbioticus TaxID=576611 RepID=UPI0008FB9E05|nr:site-2 protease family protein [Polynucleobacter asymbioticus]APC06495.1 peptidase [Polynucleobacter asymbioticus]
MQALITLGAFLVTLGVLVSFHEFGHFLAARACGVRVLRFSIGFGKPFFTYQANNKTEWTLAPIPLGGYVKLLDGRDRTQSISLVEQSEAYDYKPLWKRSLIVAAGPFANFFLAILLFAGLYLSGVPQLPAVLQAPPENSIAAQLDLRAGDQVLGWHQLDSGVKSVPLSGEFKSIPSWNALRWRLMDALAGEYGFELEMLGPDGQRFTKVFLAEDLPRLSPNADPVAKLGILPVATPLADWKELKLGPIDAVCFAAERVYLISKLSVRVMAGIVTGKTSFKQLGGPLSIADMAGKTAQVGWQPFLAFLALMSISIGILNLLPFPMLDGGQLLYDAWELVAGKRISISRQEQLQKVGFFLLIFISLLALFNDLQRYLSP